MLLLCFVHFRRFFAKGVDDRPLVVVVKDSLRGVSRIIAVYRFAARRSVRGSIYVNLLGFLPLLSLSSLHFVFILYAYLCPNTLMVAL